MTALRRLMEATFDYDDSHPDFVRPVSIENSHQADYLKRLPTMQSVNADVIATLEAILIRGCEAGVFTRDCSAWMST
jgi:hypothetical protein